MADREKLRSDLVALLGADSVAWDPESLAKHSRDSWPLAILRAVHRRPAETPACVVQPRDTESVSRTLRYASEHQVPVVPYGGGSGVCGGILPPEDAVVVDLRKMNRVLEIDERALLVRVQAGALGAELEKTLNEKGFSCGHFPQSIDLSTVGGWVATRSAGQFSTRYGSIEDILAALEVVLPAGTVVRTKPVPRAATGPDLREIFLGSEGTLGIVTEATLRILPKPPSRVLAAFAFPALARGLEAIRQLVQAGWRPPVLRLYDELETARHFSDWAAPETALLLVLSEGPPALTEAEMAACSAACAAERGSALGPAPVEHWLEHRNDVPPLEPFFERGIVVDTIEVAAPWSAIPALYEGVAAGLRAVPGILVASAHSSHSYVTGTNLYFTFAVQTENPDRAEEIYHQCWAAAMEATLAAGGTISHHHGIGRIRRPWMAQEHGLGIGVLRALKAALDPQGIMNPGVLLP